MGNFKKIATVFVLTHMMIFSGLVYGQSNSFNLADYKLPNLERHTLDFDFNLSGNNSYRTLDENFFDPRKYGGHYFYNYLSAYYTYLLNNERNQRNYFVNFYVNSALSGNDVPDGDRMVRNRRINPYFNSSFVNRFYIDEKRFFEVSPRLRNELDNDYRREENNGIESKTSQFSNRFSVNLPVRVGIGRIEPVQDARQSVYIYDALADVNRTSTVKSDEEILELARFISKLKNMRIFDSRMRWIYELEALDSLLKSNNQISENDATYFATLNDYWVYGGSPTRLSGQRVSLALIPGLARIYNSYNDLITDENSSESTTSFLSFYGGIEYVREKPIDLTWQNSINANIYGGMTRESRIENEQTFTSPSLLLGATQKWGYYPNTRTSATLLYGLQFTRVFDAISSSELLYYSSGISGVRATTQFNISYFVSPRMQVIGGLSLGYIWQNSESPLTINFYFMPEESYGYSHPFSVGQLIVGDIFASYGVTIKYSLF